MAKEMVTKERARKKVATKEKKEKIKKTPTAYNLFMQKEIKRLREKYPEKPHTMIFKEVAEQWRTASENPKNASSRRQG